MSFLRVLNRFYGIRDFPYLKLGIRDLRAKSRRDSGLKLCGRVRMPEMTLGITGLHEILSRDYGIEGLCRGPSFLRNRSQIMSQCGKQNSLWRDAGGTAGWAPGDTAWRPQHGCSAVNGG